MSQLSKHTALFLVGLFVITPFSTFAQTQTQAQAAPSVTNLTNQQFGVEWFNGTHKDDEVWDYSTSYSNPNYGTHDWIAHHAVNLLPLYERQFIENNWNAFLLGTEAPDNASLDFLGTNTGYGDFYNHEVLFGPSKEVRFDGAAIRAQEEFNKASAQLPWNEQLGAYYAGAMTHYIADVAAYPHVMGTNSHNGTETYHEQYERGINYWTQQYNGGAFEKYLTYNSSLDLVSAYTTTMNVARTTDFGYGNTMNAAWMNANIPVVGDSFYVTGNATFTNSAGDSLNRAVNAIADVLHTLAVQSGYVIERVPSSSNASRFDTAVQIAKKVYPAAGSAESVVLVSGYEFVDAVAAVPFAKQKNGVILFTYEDELPAATYNEIVRLLPNTSSSKIYIIGGTEVIDDSIKNQLDAAFNYTITRVGEVNRYDTSVQIAKKMTTSNTAFLAPTNPVDAIAASAVAARDNRPILLSRGDSLSTEISTFLTSHAKGQAISHIYVLGGSAVVTGTVVSQLQGLGITVTRIAGATDRFDTAKAINDTFFTNPTQIILANGYNMVDVLAGGVFAGRYNVPIMLVASTYAPTATTNYISWNSATLTRGYIFGGLSAVSYPVERDTGADL